MEICLCGKTFGVRSSLYLHIRKFHEGDYENYIVGDKKPPFHSGRKCPSCGLLCKNMDDLCEHIDTFHGIHMQFTSHVFDSHTDFKSWLLDVERKSCAQFVQESKKNLRLCHRSGYYVPKLTAMERKRAVKAFASNKIEAVCPAHIKVVADSAGRVEIKFQSVHLGHENEPGSLNLTKIEKDEIAEKLMQGITRKRIMKDARRKLPSNDTDEDEDADDTDDADESFRVNTRMQLITTKDLINIENQYGIQSNGDPISCHGSDSVSFTSWVEEELKKNEKRVLYYKAQGEEDKSIASVQDFILVLQTKEQKKMLLDFGHDRVCIDGTHGTNGYDFMLTTIIVVDEYNEGYPVAHCLTTSENTVVMKIFFNAIKENCGVIACKTFMSDDAPVYRNAWTEVMGKPGHILLCMWHVDRAWQAQMKKIVNEKKRTEAYQLLKSCSIILDEEEFETAHKTLLDSWAGDTDMTTFLHYFEKYYTPRREMWAAAYRKGCRLNVNMRIENFHKQFKHRFLNGKKSKRVDKCVNALLVLLEEKVEDRQLKLNRGKSGHRTAEILKRHQAGLQMNEKSDHTPIPNSKHSECSAACGLYCHDCKVCYYGCECTCYSYLIKGEICKHVHFRMANETRKFEVRRAVPGPAPKPSTPDLHESIEINHALMNKILPNLNTNTNLEGHSAIRKHLESILRIQNMRGNPSFNLTEEACREPANKKIKSQPRLYSIKKKNKKSNKLGKANCRITAALQNALIKGIAEERSDGSLALEHCYT